MDLCICRACLNKQHNEKYDFLFDKKLEWNFPELFLLIGGVQVDDATGLPVHICNDCKTKLIESYKFRCLCIASDNLLKTENFQLESIASKNNIKEYKQPINSYNTNWNIEQLNNELNYLDSICDSSAQNSNENAEQKVFVLVAHADNCLNRNDKSPSENEEEINCKPSLSSDSEFICSICGKTFSDKRSLKKHQIYHNGYKTKCPICPKYFAHKSNLKRHIIVHNGKNPLTCDKCESTFTEPAELYDHIKTHAIIDRTDNYLLECEQCGEKTASYAIFNNHMKTVHNVEGNIRAFQCHVCNMRFVSKQGMYRHIDNIHENNRRNLRNRNKNFLCNTCGKRFSTNFHLDVHVRSHTGERPYRCEYCDKAFAQMSGLKMHTFIHTGEKPFKCKVCAKSFNQYGHVREHMLTHSDVRPHVCNVCNHSFRVKGNLTSHMLIHKGKKPYECDLCSKRFLQSTKLKQHKIKNHKITAS